MKKVIRLTESELIDMVKRIINEQGTIISAPQKPQFPKDDKMLNGLPNTPDGGKKFTGVTGGVEILYPDGKTKSGKCWCSTKGGIIATVCDAIAVHCKDATAGWGAR